MIGHDAMHSFWPVQVGLGTDVAGGYSPSMLNAVRSAVIASRVVEDSEAAHLIDTHGGMAETERLEVGSHQCW